MKGLSRDEQEAIKEVAPSPKERRVLLRRGGAVLSTGVFNKVVKEVFNRVLKEVFKEVLKGGVQAGVPSMQRPAPVVGAH
jgi:hypothetical protein